MMDADAQQKHRDRFLSMLKSAGIAITPAESRQVELAGFGLDDFEVEGLGLIVYENNPRYCAKELIMLPGQTCPQHRHPPVGDDPGKMETFRCRAGKVFLYLDGTDERGRASCQPPPGKEAFYTVWREVVLSPGEQHTIPPNTWHWFQAGSDGAIVSEFSSTSRDEADVFADPAIRRVE